MRGWGLQLVVLLVAVASLAFGQVGNGTITGTVTDPAGAVVAGATVTAKNAETGVAYQATSTSTGNYTIGDLPVGTYTITVGATGFKGYSHSNLAVAATQVLREDVPLQIGASSESVTVTAEASLLKTETGELAHNITLQQIDDLPLLGIGTVNAGTSGYRNPYNTLLTLPGVSGYASSGLFVLNGLGSAFGLTETMRTDGQDSTSRIFGNYQYTQMAQPSADAIQEIAYQTSNYSAEYGQAGIAVINMTMKSGTNQYHGDGFDYFVNEDLNAGDPFSISGGPGSPTGGNGGKYRPRNRRNDFGGSMGGPIVIPKIYNGHNKTFWFFNYEQFAESTQYSFIDTVPTPAYLGGDFSAISANGTCSLCAQYGIPTTALGVPNVQLDPHGQVNYANEIFDPLTRTVATSGPLAGQGYALPFLNNMIPVSRFDPVSVKIQSLVTSLGATSQNANLSGNYDGRIQGGRYSAIPSVKIDHNISAKDKLSFYYSENNTESQISSPLGNADGLPTEIGGYRGTFIPTYTERLNYDRTLTPTILLHLGAGYLHTSFSDRAPFLDFNPSQFGLGGFLNDRQFPSFTGMNSCGGSVFAPCTAYGGLQNIGTSGQIQSLNYEEKPSFVANTTWVHGKHTYKFGAELYLEQTYTGAFSGVTLATGVGPTSDPFTPTNSYNGYNTGFGYASFLLGDYSSITQTPQENTREGNQQWGLFAQDSWKVTRKLTVDYGLRWDFATPEHEQYGRLGQFDSTLANPLAGGHPGSTIFANTCNCSFYQSAYPYAIGPRLGVAYQITPKTVFRAGWGVNYQFVANPAGATIGTNGVYPVAANSPAYIPPAAQFVNDQVPGAIQQPVWPVSSNIYPVPGTVGPAPYMPDGQENRPPRVNTFSAGFQQEFTRSFVMEFSYVGNRAAWIPGGPLGYQSQLSPANYAAYGLYPYPGTGPCPSGPGVCANPGYNNLADYQLTLLPISSTSVIQRLGNVIPYAGFPTSTSLANTIIPFPQYGTIEPSGSPTGNSKYDSLQIKATKRLSHHIQAGGSYTWGQGFTRPVRQDFFNPQSAVWELQQIPPQTLTFNATYTVPKASFFPRYVNAITNDWQVGWFSTYQSGMFLAPPLSPTLNFLPSEDILNPGQSFYTVSNINNIHSYSTLSQTVLNPNAWSACPSNAACAAAGLVPGFFGPAAGATVYYKGFRAPRTPVENANFGRNFRIKERMNLQVRGEFVNVFNRTLLPPPSTSNPQNAVVHGGAQGQLTSGFGVIDTYLTPNTGYALPTAATAPYLEGRTGTLIARFSF
ncbi:MAG TPA: TonB-dependent receptor [Bryobacteraceae bacterium]|jgi:hypothetical protein